MVNYLTMSCWVQLVVGASVPYVDGGASEYGMLGVATGHGFSQRLNALCARSS